MKYRLHVDARKDLQEATYYYTNVSQSLADDFLAEIEECISRILTFPEAWTPLPSGARRCRTNRFPYGLIYRIHDNLIFIMAVMHFSSKAGVLGIQGSAMIIGT